jgi:hypothetical protein
MAHMSKANPTKVDETVSHHSRIFIGAEKREGRDSQKIGQIWPAAETEFRSAEWAQRTLPFTTANSTTSGFAIIQLSSWPSPDLSEIELADLRDSVREMKEGKAKDFDNMDDALVDLERE